MKKIFQKFLIIMTVAAGTLALPACGDNDKGDLNFSSYDFSVTADGADSDSLRAIMHDFDGRWTVNLSGILPERLGDKDVSILRDSLLVLANLKEDEDGKLSVSLPSELKELSEDRASSDSLKSKTPGSILNHQLSLDLLTPKFAVFRSYTYSYPEGAAHPAFANGYLNYDIEKGRIILQTDIFTDGFSEMLRPAIYNRLAEQGVDLQLEKEEFFTTKQFRMTTSGVEFIYGIYEIAPYSDGEPTVFFTYSELASLLKPAAKKMLLEE
ncbi:MAG: RsiV family protein [Muribaculaceae bacterium]|nr:RsiV family protein [Muribaculaceae bacterium]